MIDVWQIVCLMMPFLEILLHSILHVLQKRRTTFTVVKPIDGEFDMSTDQKNEKVIRVIRNLATYGIPFCYTTFLMTFFCIGLWLA